MHNGLKVLIWNVRSLYNKFDIISHELPNISVINISEVGYGVRWRIILLV